MGFTSQLIRTYRRRVLLFYSTRGHFKDSFFKKQRHEKLKIAEIGILDGASLLMWREYFNNSEIFGFEYNNDLINNFKNNFDNSNIKLANINVNSESSIYNSFQNINSLLNYS